MTILTRLQEVLGVEGGERASPKRLAMCPYMPPSLNNPPRIVASVVPLSEYYAAWVSPPLARTTRGCILRWNTVLSAEPAIAMVSIQPEDTLGLPMW